MAVQAEGWKAKEKTQNECNLPVWSPQGRAKPPAEPLCRELAESVEPLSYTSDTSDPSGALNPLARHPDLVLNHKPRGVITGGMPEILKFD